MTMKSDITESMIDSLHPDVVFVSLIAGNTEGVECVGGPLDGKRVDKSVKAFRYISVSTGQARVIERDIDGHTKTLDPITHEGWYRQEDVISPWWLVSWSRHFKKRAVIEPKYYWKEGY